MYQTVQVFASQADKGGGCKEVGDIESCSNCLSPLLGNRCKAKQPLGTDAFPGMSSRSAPSQASLSSRFPKKPSLLLPILGNAGFKLRTTQGGSLPDRRQRNQRTAPTPRLTPDGVMRGIILSPFQGWEERLCAPLGKTLAQEQLPMSHYSATPTADTFPQSIQH